jgi:pimeloyl-ACP methyl ester carboxylesterase
MKIEAFEIDIPEADLRDLHDRLVATRWPGPAPSPAWEDGPDLGFMQRLAAYWRDGFDWRAQERRLNALPQFMAALDGQDIHFVHARGEGSSPMPLILTHGWPGSFLEFEQILPMLTHPSLFGGDAADAFDVVIPSLPGFGFSPAPTRPGTSPRRIAGLWVELMRGLGYGRFGVQGGDIGAGVSVWAARLFPEAVASIHLNYIPGSYQPPLSPDAAPLSWEEEAFQFAAADWSKAEGAYAHIHATRPQTLAYALTDSPIGLAAWLTEKYRAWSDCEGDLERVFDLDHLLTTLSLYWFSGTAGDAIRLYKEGAADPLIFDRGERVAPPVSVALFPRELPMPPRSWVERVFDVQRWTPMAAGGHFAAAEQPERLAEDIRAAMRTVR